MSNVAPAGENVVEGISLADVDWGLHSVGRLECHMELRLHVTADEAWIDVFDSADDQGTPEDVWRGRRNIYVLEASPVMDVSYNSLINGLLVHGVCLLVRNVQAEFAEYGCSQGEAHDALELVDSMSRRDDEVGFTYADSFRAEEADSWFGDLSDAEIRVALSESDDYLRDEAREECVFLYGLDSWRRHATQRLEDA